ncbi:MAG TPA: S9 family peptidase [Gemmatimonadales bacterium]|nr:S9 family peptidase [Gemmatimonadales bacterium]
MTTLRHFARAATLLAVAAFPLTAQHGPLDVHRVWGTRDFAPDLVPVQWADQGPYFTTTAEDDSGRTSLYRVDAATGTRTLLIAAADLVPPGATAPVAIEDYHFSSDGATVLIFTNSVRVWRRNTKGTFYVWDLKAKKLQPVSTRPGYQQFAKLSPDGRLVGFVRDNNLFVSDLTTGTELRLTTDGSADVINGTSDWVYEEELDLRDAWRWSPDSKRIAFWRLDQSPIQPFYLLDMDSLHPALEPVRYPKAGERNSRVQIGVVNVANGATTWIDLGPDKDIYVANVGFAGAPDELWLTRLNRHQNQLDLLLASVTTGASRIVMTDRDSAWVDAHTPTWLAGGKQFLFESERDGTDQLYLFNRDGSLVRRVTPGGWDVAAVYGVDEKKGVVYFSGAIDNPMTRPILRVALDGTHLTRIATGPGVHNPEFSADYSLYVDTYSRAGIPPVETLRRADGAAVRTIADDHALIARVDSLGLRAPEFVQLPGADGTMLNAWIIKPANFDPAKRYPLLLSVYGGPGSQTVIDAWGGQNYVWHQLLARDGYLVASVDNRGTGARGTKFKKATYLHLGKLESDDQIAAARWFGRQAYVDAARIGIWGWSYGGYMSSLSMFRGDGVFAAALAVAPVTDWRFYDTIYTERYMRTPQENPQGYSDGAPLAYADRLKGKFLLVHGTGDDNVHFQNSVRLVQALEAANKQFEFRIYPNRTHSIAGGNTRENLFGLFTRWLEANL